MAQPLSYGYKARITTESGTTYHSVVFSARAAAWSWVNIGVQPKRDTDPVQSAEIITIATTPQKTQRRKS